MYGIYWAQFVVARAGRAARIKVNGPLFPRSKTFSSQSLFLARISHLHMTTYSGSHKTSKSVYSSFDFIKLCASTHNAVLDGKAPAEHSTMLYFVHSSAHSTFEFLGQEFQ